ncbi:hypothetical protein BSKO_08327 [Bryopsis sp. KO-2023]|nr:hypothetical protein BSKO_08327 [Bryopsis sp. KO-2023]
MCDDLGLNGMLDVPVHETENGGCGSSCAKNQGCGGENLCGGDGASLRSNTGCRGESTQNGACRSNNENGGVSSSQACSKCKEMEAVASIRQNERVCAECLFEAVRAKFRYALKTKGVINRGDRVLVPATGDSATQALLDLLLVHRNPDDSRPVRGKVNFALGVVWVDASCLDERENITQYRSPLERVRSGVESVMEMHGCGNVDFVRIPLEDIALDTGHETGPRLKQVLDGVSDQTGKEDFIKHLKRRLIIQYAESNSFNKIASADSATSIAIHLIGSSAKARGFDLPGDIHYHDARLGAGNPVEIRPLRDLFSKELGVYCHFRNIPTCSSLRGLSEKSEKKSINDLAENFVLGLQSAFPSGLSSILRTGSKLQSFEFNRDHPVGGTHESDIEPSRLCRLCYAPMPSEMVNLGKDVEEMASCWKEKFCFCCLTQIVLKYRGSGSGDISGLEEFRSFLEIIGIVV